MRIRQGNGRVEFLSDDEIVRFGEYREGVCVKCKRKLAWGSSVGVFQELVELNLEKMGFVIGRVKGACADCEEDIEKAMMVILEKMQGGGGDIDTEGIFDGNGLSVFSGGSPDEIR